MAEILRQHHPTLSEAEIERIADISQGNALYLQSVVSELGENPTFDVRQMPRTVEDYFGALTQPVRTDINPLLRDVLGLLSVARKPLSLAELGELTGRVQSIVFETAIRQIRSCLVEIDGGYSFYHASFHDYVMRSLLGEDELARYHGKIASWLRPKLTGPRDYRRNSLCYHLFHSPAPVSEQLPQIINTGFLAEKVRMDGYAVLEDVELLARSMLERGDATLVQHCVEMVEGLREVVGGDVVKDTRHAMQSYGAGLTSFRTQVIAPVLPTIDGLDVYGAMLPKAEVAADFFDVIPHEQGLVVVIGDAPGSGLKSAFVARFLKILFRRLIERSERPNMAEVLSQLNVTISTHEYFETVSMQCARVDRSHGILALANAGHPYPVLYSARRGKCDRLPVRGNRLAVTADHHAASAHYAQRHAEIGSGDIIVMITDGLTEGHKLIGEPYGYQFEWIMIEKAGESARAIGEAILDHWRKFPRDKHYGDDVTVLVVCVR